MQAPISHVLPLTMIRRARMLPVNGRVLARVGQKVNATDVVADADVSNKHILLNIRRALNLSAFDDFRKVIEHRVGDKVQEGDVIAETSGIFKRVVYAPAAGQIVSISGGQLLLEVQGEPFKLQAGLNGEVTEVIPEQGVILETHGALIQGVWGNGKINMGMLLNLAQEAGEELTSDRMDVSMRGAVVLGGHCSSAEVFRVGMELPLRGLILGSMSADLVPIARQVDYPVILTEGFGIYPLNNIAYRILTTNERRDVCLNAVEWDAYTGDRPEVIIPLPATGNLAPEVAQFKAGHTVRIKGAPYSKQVVGVLVEMLPGLTLMPNGLRVPAASVRLENNEEINIPLANLDVLD